MEIEAYKLRGGETGERKGASELFEENKLQTSPQGVANAFDETEPYCKFETRLKSKHLQNYFDESSLYLPPRNLSLSLEPACQIDGKTIKSLFVDVRNEEYRRAYYKYKDNLSRTKNFNEQESSFPTTIDYNCETTIILRRLEKELADSETISLFLSSSELMVVNNMDLCNRLLLNARTFSVSTGELYEVHDFTGQEKKLQIKVWKAKNYDNRGRQNSLNEWLDNSPTEKSLEETVLKYIPSFSLVITLVDIKGNNRTRIQATNSNNLCIRLKDSRHCISFSARESDHGWYVDYSLPFLDTFVQVIPGGSRAWKRLYVYNIFTLTLPLLDDTKFFSIVCETITLPENYDQKNKKKKTSQEKGALLKQQEQEQQQQQQQEDDYNPQFVYTDALFKEMEKMPNIDEFI